MAKISLLLVSVALLTCASLLAQRSPAKAATGGDCTVADAALDAEETDFLNQLQAWRDTHVSPSSDLQVSGALNRAAAWFAEYQINHGAKGGHLDDSVPGGRSFNDRAWDCGYTGTTLTGIRFADGTGEGIYAVASSSGLAVGPSQAISGITYTGSGVWLFTPSTGLPAKCVGAAVRRNASGTMVVWVALIGQYPASQACPGGSSTLPTVAPTTATTTPTSSATPSPSASPTATPTRTPSPTGSTGLPRRVSMPALAID